MAGSDRWDLVSRLIGVLWLVFFYSKACVLISAFHLKKQSVLLYKELNGEKPCDEIQQTFLFGRGTIQEPGRRLLDLDGSMSK